MTKEIHEEISAGGVLVRREKGIKQALLIKIRSYGYEIPKGHPENDETFEQAAKRELCEETSLLTEPVIGIYLGQLDYTFTYDNKTIHKTVYYYSFSIKEEPIFGKRHFCVKEIKWINKADLSRISLVYEKLRPIINKALV